MQRVHLLLAQGRRRLLQLAGRGWLAAAFGACSSLGGCPAPSPEPPGDPFCTLATLGDRGKPIQLEVIARGADGRSSPVKDGDDVSLVFPPQGGRVIFAGVRATNLDPCAVKLSGALRDETSLNVRVDTRTVNLKPTGDGWGASLDTDISSFSNVPTCPNQWADTDVFDHEFELTLTVTERGGRSATQTLKVKPRCAEPAREAECRCICKRGYVLGEACAGSDAGPADGGVDATSDVSAEGG